MRRILTAILLGIIAAVVVAAMDIPFTLNEGILYVGVAAVLGLLLGGSKKRSAGRSGSRSYADDAWDDSGHDDDDGGDDGGDD
ncbi:MAG: hypothetical protein IMY84_02315 [Chloroflexi bacterium]|nr:hypothetical protein [Chloroflexota bacterium]